VKAGEAAGHLTDVKDAIDVITQVEAEAAEIFVQAQEDKVKASEELHKQQQTVQQQEQQMIGLRQRGVSQLVQSTVSTTQFVATMRLLGAESQTVEDLAKDFIFLQTAIQALSLGHKVIQDLSGAVASFSQAGELVDEASVAVGSIGEASELAGQANELLATGQSAVNTAMEASGAASATALGGVVSIGAAVAVALPLLAAAAIAHHLYTQRLEEEAQAERQLLIEMERTTIEVGLRGDAMERLIDLEKRQRQFTEGLRGGAAKTEEEIQQDLDFNINRKDLSLKNDATSLLQNKKQEILDRTEPGQEESIGEQLAALQREKAKLAGDLNNETFLKENGGLDKHEANRNLGRINVIKSLQKNADEKVEEIEQSSGLRFVNNARKKIDDGTDSEELRKQGGVLRGTNGLQDIGDALQALGTADVVKEMDLLQASMDEAERSAAILRAEGQRALNSDNVQRALREQPIEDRLAENRKDFDLDSSKKFQLDDLIYQAEYGEKTGENKRESFKNLENFAVGEGIADTQLDIFKKAIKDRSVADFKAALDDSATVDRGKGKSDDDSDNRALNAAADIVDSAERHAESLERVRDALAVKARKDFAAMQDIINNQANQ
jgi:hypothetical protein